MCGIAGIISLNKKIDKLAFQQATMLIQHRGPDAEGFFYSDDEKIGLAHRRLSILDLSETANQPMFSADGKYCIVFNGEVYNFKELKNRLTDKGTLLKTTSDTEVVLELFAQEGTDCFSLLNGMFAFAIYDIEKKVVTLCRDHVGIKPLFYYQDQNEIIFASELKVIKGLLADKLAINHTAVPYFLHLGFIPQPLTIYQNTYKFSSAHYVQINTDQISNIQTNVCCYWKLENKISNKVLSSESTAKSQLKDLLFDAVEKQLISDVPIGTFLSGGIDSSLISAIASKVSDNKKVKTFSIAVDENKFNESAYAKSVADYLKTDHYEFKVKEKEVEELVDKLIPTYDEPFADSSAFPTMIVSRMARQHVKVALSGDGGDELFLGYGMYNWANRLSNPMVPFFKNIISSGSKLLNNRYQRAGNVFDYPSKENIKSHVFSQEQYFFKEQELFGLLKNQGFNFSDINVTSKLNRTLTPAEQQSLWDFNYYLKDDLLVKVDRASMLFSLESRVPLLDYRIAEFAYNLDVNLKIKNGENKYLLKQVLYDFVPKELFNRPKWGFGIPLEKWLKTDFKYLLDKYTSQEIIDKYGMLNYVAVEKIRTSYLKGVSYLYNRLWVVIVLHWWLEEN